MKGERGREVLFRMSTADNLKISKTHLHIDLYEYSIGIQHMKGKGPFLRSTRSWWMDLLRSLAVRCLAVRRWAWWLRWRHPRLTAKLQSKMQNIQEIWWLNQAKFPKTSKKQNKIDAMLREHHSIIKIIVPYQTRYRSLRLQRQMKPS